MVLSDANALFESEGLAEPRRRGADVRGAYRISKEVAQTGTVTGRPSTMIRSRAGMNSEVIKTPG